MKPAVTIQLANKAAKNGRCTTHFDDPHTQTGRESN